MDILKEMGIQHKAEESSRVKRALKSFEDYKEKNDDSKHWEYKFHKKNYEDALNKEIKILKGEIFVIYQNSETKKYTASDKYDDNKYQRYEAWQLSKSKEVSVLWDSQNKSTIGDNPFAIYTTSIQYTYLDASITEEGKHIFLGWENSYDGGSADSNFRPCLA